MNFMPWSPTDQVILWAFNILIQISFIALVAILAGLVLRRSPAARYWLLCCALFLISFCPIYTAVLQSTGYSLFSIPRRNHLSPTLLMSSQDTLAAVQPTGLPLTDPSTISNPETNALPTRNHVESVRPVQDAVPVSALENSIEPAEPIFYFANTAASSQGGWLLPPVVAASLMIWCCVSLGLLIRFAVNWLRLSKLVQTAKENTSGHLAETLNQSWLALNPDHGRRLPRLLFSDQVSGPVAVGIRSPGIILPESLPEQVNAEQLRNVLIHELAHLLRGDQIVVLLQNIIRALFWLHPLVGLLNRQVAQSREEVCDNYVLSVTDASSYSLTLLTLSQLLNTPRAIPGTVGLFTSRWKLEQRVAGLLDERRSLVTRLSLRAWSLIIVLSAGLAITTASGTVSMAAAETVKSDQPVNASQKSNSTQPETPDVSVKKPTVTDKTKKNSAPTDQAFSYTGKVIDSQGNPVEGATINVVHSSAHRLNAGADIFVPTHNSLARVHTNTDGHFRVEFNDGWTRFHRDPKNQLILSGSNPGTIILATAPEHAPAWISTLDHTQGKPLQFVLRENTPPIRGQLVNQAGEGIDGLTVSLVSLWNTNEGAVDRWLQELPELRKQGLLPSYENHILQDSDQSTAGQFPVDTHVSANTPGIPSTFKTNREGRFLIPDLGKDRLAILKIKGPGIATQFIAVVTREMQLVQARPLERSDLVNATYYGADFRLVPEPDLVIDGIVRDRETGAPISARITAIRTGYRIKRPGYNNTHIRDIDLYCTTDAEGKFRIENLPRHSEVFLNVIPEGDQPYFRTPLYFAEPEGNEPVSLDVKLRRAILFRGKITDQRTGKPVPDVRFDYFPLRSNKNAIQYLRYQAPGNAVQPMRQRFKSAADGSFSLLGIPGEGIIAAQLRNPDYQTGAGLEELKDLINKNVSTLKTYDYCSITSYQTLKLVTVPPGEKEFNVELQIDRGACVPFEVVGPDGNPLTEYTINGRPDTRTKGNHSTIDGFYENQTHTIFFQHRGLHLGRAVTISGVPEDGLVQKVQLEPMGTVKGQLTTEKGIPLTGSRIELLRRAIPGTDSAPNHDIIRVEKSFQCEPDGDFEFHNLLVGAEYSLFSVLGSYHLPERIKVKPGETIELGVIKVPEKK
ncbi:MAG TPA: hypothetical protein DCM07_17285 [Planctomycetaceae bacterium]|nr:hypothetical protein [Planctomycetaceae bacterium]